MNIQRQSVGVFLAVTASLSVSLVIAGNSMADDKKETNPEPATIEKLIADLSSPDGKVRIAATTVLFDRGQKVLPDLKKVGAKQISPSGTIASTRLDVVYSLIEGLRPNQPDKPGGRVYGGYTANGFGITFEKEITDDDTSRIGKKYGFQPVGKLDPDRQSQPSCYVMLAKGKKLEDVLKHLLAEEPNVVTINLNYFEK